MKNNGQIVLVPAGGLANRMRSIASVYAMAQKVKSKLQIIWFRDKGLNAYFHKIFETERLPIREARFLDYILYDRPRPKNLYFQKIPQSIIFEQRLYEQEIKPLKLQGFNFYEWAKESNCYMGNYMDFGEFPNSLYHELFHPVKEIRDATLQFLSNFSEHTIGMHIRRTDLTLAIEKSPTFLFSKKIEEEIDLHQDTKIFLATDSEDVKFELRQKFGNRIISFTEEANRNTLQGIRDGLTDMYTLAKTKKIYGSKGSTFSVMAANLGENDLEILESPI